jgi:hypothetical protein
MEWLLPLGVLDPLRTLMYVAIVAVVAFLIYLPRLMRKLRSGQPVSRIVSWPVIVIPAGIGFFVLGFLFDDVLQESTLRAAFMNFAYRHDIRSSLAWGSSALIVAAAAYSVLRERALVLGLAIWSISTACFLALVWYAGDAPSMSLGIYTVPFFAELIFAPLGALGMRRLLGPGTRALRVCVLIVIFAVLILGMLIFNTNLFIR